MNTAPDTAFGTADAAQSWRRSYAVRRLAMAATTERLLDLAGVVPGARVLDVGTGTGDTALEAAALVGPAGRVLATDFSAAMVAEAREAVRAAGATNVEVRGMDAANPDAPRGSFDAVVARNALMFVPGLADAVERLRWCLKPGGRLASSSWGPRAKNPFHDVPMRLVAELGRMPDPTPHIVTAFSLSDAGALAALFEVAGFTEVTVEPVSVARRFLSAAAAVAFQRDSAPMAELTTRLTPAAREELFAELERRYAAFEGPEGCVLGGEQLIAAGTNPG